MDEADYNKVDEPIAQPLQPSSSDNPEKLYGFSHLAIRSLPQLLVFNGAISLFVAFLLWILDYIANVLLASVGTALTTANASQVLLSWQGVLLATVTTVIVAGYVAVDVFAHVYFCESLLAGEPGNLFRRAIRSMNRAFKSLGRFKTLGGVAIFIYIVLISPLTGVGFSTGLTRDLYVPHFIMSVIEGTPIFLVAYAIAIVVLVVVGLMHFFAIFDVLLAGSSPKQALRNSRHLVRTNFKGLVKALVKPAITIVLLLGILALLYTIANFVLLMLDQGYTPGEEGVLVYLLNGLEPTPESIAVSIYRSLCCFVGLVVLGVITIGGLLAASCAMLYATHLYHWVSGEQQEKPLYAVLPVRRRGWAVVRVLVALLAVGLVAFVGGLTLDFWMNRDAPVQVVAHRLGGDGAPENSLEGLEFAIGEGCYGAETDIQRTKDGQYVINHDKDFSRLCGSDAKTQDLTLEEAQQLRIHDPLHPGTEARVLSFEEALDAAKGRIKLFVEFKGSSADRQMVDDAVRIVREHKAERDVVFISLNYDCIEYGQETYPEFDFGVLIFAGFGDMNLLKCDIVLAEEEMTNSDFIEKVHAADKEMGVWTANTEEDLRKVLYSDADFVITDKIVFAHDVQKDLSMRSDNEVIQDFIWQ